LFILGSREAHQNQKVLRQERKSNKAGYEVIIEAKKIWEKLRRGDIKRDEKQKLMKEIMVLIEGRVGDVSGWMQFSWNHLKNHSKTLY